MFAVIKTGGKQYKVAADDKITVMTLKGEPGDVVSFDNVLALFDGSASHVGAPHVAGASVAGTIVSHERGAKVIAFKKRRRKNSRRKRGHKQDLTIVQITDILTGGAKPAHRTGASAAPAALLSERASAHHAAESAAKASGLDTTKFQRLDKPFGAPDDLEWIHGIGPGIAEKLHGIGVYHFWQVAALSPQDIAEIEHEVGFSGRAERDHWKDQARDLMAGKPPAPKTGHHQHEDRA
jgi:large subunit ribosomal protein L21